MKCRVCRGHAIIDVRRHNANFCSHHFVRYCHQQVEKAIGEHAMCRPDERLLRRQLPVLPEGNRFPRKIKPLIRLAERETAAYCVLRGIDYQLDECPMAAGNKHSVYKKALNEIELESPGVKTAFYFEFLRRMAPLLEAEVDTGDHDAHGDVIGRCRSCDGPTDNEVRALCRLVDRVTVR